MADSGYNSRLVTTAAWKPFATQPSVRFRKNAKFYLVYDGFWFVFCAVALAVMAATHWAGVFPQWKMWHIALIPVACYIQILCSVFIHNCTHGNFPRPINRLIGEICGLVVLTRYASWEIIHQRHHTFSDSVEKDPHPCQSNYWKYALATVTNVEKQLQTQFFDFHGDTPENRTYERRRAYVSYATNILLILAWYFFLGPVGFFAFFVPAFVVGFLHLIHFNWSTHNGDRGKKPEDFQPVNRNEGLYWLGNILFFGIYWHANHHYRPTLFNPKALNTLAPKIALKLPRVSLNPLSTNESSAE